MGSRSLAPAQAVIPAQAGIHFELSSFDFPLLPTNTGQGQWTLFSPNPKSQFLIPAF